MSVVSISKKKKKISPKNNFHTLTHPSKGVHNNIVKALKFTKSKLRQRCLDNNLQKVSQTNFLENAIE